jgi:NAD/NADP transhydrogenase alpha subunit
MKSSNILLCKETRAGERRVALIPNDVQKLIQEGHHVFVEHDAGQAAGFSDDVYENVGATIRQLSENSLAGYQAFFKNINLVVRAKRPDRVREILENKALLPGTIMVGALDPLEKNSPHIEEYQQAQLVIHSIDQLRLPVDDPMNMLAVMSKIAGALCLKDAIQRCLHPIKKIVIIGFGVVGRAAYAEALKQGLPVTVILTNPEYQAEILSQSQQVVLLEKQAALFAQQKIVKDTLLDADIVITGARHANKPAPLLIPLATLKALRKGTVIVDMALSEGGNVEGSEHDQTHVLGNEVIVTNTSGYPKVMPHESSQLWSKASQLFISQLART